jgi:hypothetical protein
MPSSAEAKQLVTLSAFGRFTPESGHSAYGQKKKYRTLLGQSRFAHVFLITRDILRPL